MPPSARVFSTLDAGPVIMIVTEAAAHAREAQVVQLEGRGVRVERFPERDLAAVLARLAEAEVLSLLVEGGPELQNAFAEAALVDRVQCVATPVTLESGVPAATIVREHLGSGRLRRLGQDTLVETDSREVGVVLDERIVRRANRVVREDERTSSDRKDCSDVHGTR